MEEIKSKLTYYRGQLKQAIKRFLHSNSRQDRDICLRLEGRVEMLKQLLEIFENQ